MDTKYSVESNEIENMESRHLMKLFFKVNYICEKNTKIVIVFFANFFFSYDEFTHLRILELVDVHDNFVGDLIEIQPVKCCTIQCTC